MNPISRLLASWKFGARLTATPRRRGLGSKDPDADQRGCACRAASGSRPGSPTSARRPPARASLELIAAAYRPRTSASCSRPAASTSSSGSSATTGRGARTADTPDGGPDPDAQVTVMSARAAALFADGPDHAAWAWAGDQLYVDLDLSCREPARLARGSRSATRGDRGDRGAAPRLRQVHPPLRRRGAQARQLGGRAGRCGCAGSTPASSSRGRSGAATSSASSPETETKGSIQGPPPMRGGNIFAEHGRMPSFLLSHQHEPRECAAAFAAWHGFDSPLRAGRAPSSCLAGEHGIWWLVDAPDGAGALALLPRFVAERTTVTPVREVLIPDHPKVRRSDMDRTRHVREPRVGDLDRRPAGRSR